MAITVDPHGSSAPPPPLELNLVGGTPLEGAEDAADNNRAERRDEKQKLARADEKHLATQDRPPPKPAPKPTQPAKVDKPAEPPRQPKTDQEKNPEVAAKAREIEQKAGQRELQDKAAAFRAIEQPKTAAAPATPEAPAKPAELGQSELKNREKEGDSKGVADAKPDSGKPSGLTKADAKTAGNETGTGTVAKGGREQVAGETAESKSSTPPSTGGKLQADTPHDFGKLLSGQQPRPNANTAQAAAASARPSDKGDPKEKTVVLAKGPLPVMTTASTPPVRKPGLFTRMAQLLNKTLGGSAPLPKPVVAAPALATVATPSGEVSEKPQAKAPKKGEVKILLATTGMGNEGEVATYVQHLVNALHFGKNIMNGGRPLPFGVPTAMVNGGKRAFDKSSPKAGAKDQEVAETRGDFSDLGRACKTGRFRGQIGNYA